MCLSASHPMKVVIVYMAVVVRERACCFRRSSSSEIQMSEQQKKVVSCQICRPAAAKITKNNSFLFAFYYSPCFAHAMSHLITQGAVVIQDIKLVGKRSERNRSDSSFSFDFQSYCLMTHESLASHPSSSHEIFSNEKVFILVISILPHSSKSFFFCFHLAPKLCKWSFALVHIEKVRYSPTLGKFGTQKTHGRELHSHSHPTKPSRSWSELHTWKKESETHQHHHQQLVLIYIHSVFQRKLSHSAGHEWISFNILFSGLGKV